MDRPVKNTPHDGWRDPWGSPRSKVRLGAWAAALPSLISVGGGILSGLMGGGDETTTTTQTRAPWAPQDDAIQHLFRSATDLFNRQNGAPFFGGALYAPWTALQQQGADALAANGARVGGMAPGVLGTGMAGLSGLPASQAAGMSLANGVPIQTGASTAAAGYTPTALNVGSAGFGTALRGLQQNTPQALAASAGSLINNGVLSGQIDASLRDIQRSLGEDILPGLNLQASLGGNINSSRAGSAEAIARRGAQDRAGDIAAGLRGNAYATGLGIANQQIGQQIAGGTALGNSGIAAANMGVGAQQAGNNALFGNAGVMSQGAGILNQGASLGAGLLNLGNQLGAQGAGQLSAAGEAQQANNQRLLDEAFQRWQGQQSHAWTPLNNYSRLVQAVNWGGTSAGQQTVPGDDPFSTGLGTFALLGGSSNRNGRPFDGGSLAGSLAGAIRGLF
jgi:hypothetical protein